MKEKLQITAYEAVEKPMPLQTADRRREWMDETTDRFAYRCLPVAIANQVGWDILSPVGFTAKWNGKDGLDAISIKYDSEASELIGSHFGFGENPEEVRPRTVWILAGLLTAIAMCEFVLGVLG